MEKRIINDLDHFIISEQLRKRDHVYLKGLQEDMIKAWGTGECMLHSDLEKYNKKEPIKFPFEVLK